MTFLAPLDDVEFNEYESDEPQQGIPPVDEIAREHPGHDRKRQDRVKNELGNRADLEGEALEAVFLLQAHVDFENEYDQ